MSFFNDEKFNDNCHECIKETHRYLRMIVPVHSWKTYDWDGHFKVSYADRHERHIMSGNL